MKKNLTGKQKAAILMIALGPAHSSTVFKQLKEEEIETLTMEIANIRKVQFQEKSSVLSEFKDMIQTQSYLNHGGIEYAKNLLEKALGTEKALSIITRLTANLHIRPFEFARRVDPSLLLHILQGEHDQTIALVLSYLEYEQAAFILSGLLVLKQFEVTRRIATMDSVSPDVIQQIESMLEKKLSSSNIQDSTKTGGIDSVIGMLNHVDRVTEKNIIEQLEREHPSLADEIKRRMFVFENIITLDSPAIQQVIRETDKSDLLLALKGSGNEVREKILANMSKRMGEAFRDDLENMKPVLLKDVQAAQSKIASYIRSLIEKEEIRIVRGGDELIF